MQAYLLIQTDADREPIAHTLRAIPGVISAEDLNGPFDAIALAGSASTQHLMEGVVARIQELPGVIRALPAPVIRSQATVGAAAAARGREAA